MNTGFHFYKFCWLYLVLSDTWGVQMKECILLLSFLWGRWLHFEANTKRSNCVKHCKRWTPFTRLWEVTYSDFFQIYVLFLFWVYLHLSHFHLSMVHHRPLHWSFFFPFTIAKGFLGLSQKNSSFFQQECFRFIIKRILDFVFWRNIRSVIHDEKSKNSKWLILSAIWWGLTMAIKEGRWDGKILKNWLYRETLDPENECQN